MVTDNLRPGGIEDHPNSTLVPCDASEKTISPFHEEAEGTPQTHRIDSKHLSAIFNKTQSETLDSPKCSAYDSFEFGPTFDLQRGCRFYSVMVALHIGKKMEASS